MKRYHHPDLRNVLLAAALEELKEKGPRNFSLRQVASRAGVSHAAPYRHFPDKAALLAALVREGMRSLTSDLRAARSRAVETARERLGNLGRAYVVFGRGHPQVLSLMFSGLGFGVLGSVPPDEEHEADHDAFGVLESTVRECQREGSLDPEADAGVLSILVWSTAHGLAVLYNEGVIPAMAAERGLPEDRVEAAILRALGEFFHPG